MRLTCCTASYNTSPLHIPPPDWGGITPTYPFAVGVPGDRTNAGNPYITAGSVCPTTKKMSRCSTTTPPRPHKNAMRGGWLKVVYPPPSSGGGGGLYIYMAAGALRRGLYIYKKRAGGADPPPRWVFVSFM
jgi:hypothetical protein